MSRSQNGWTASPTLRTRSFEPVKGVKLRVVDNEDVITIFTYVAQQFHARVDKITGPHPADDWGYNYRPNRNDPNSLSNHASGTAIDLDATEFPNGVPTRKVMSSKQIDEVHKILKELRGAVRWGGDYRGTPDAMHFEIDKSPSELRDIAKVIRNLLADPRPKPAPSPKPSGKKTVKELAEEVIRGEWGNGDERVRRLSDAGYLYSEVQKEVNRSLSDSKPAPKKSTTLLAKEVIAGKWGNGQDRIDKLTRAGHNAKLVQAAVNKLLT